MQFLLSSHRFRTLVTHRSSHLRWAARPQRVFAFPQDVVSQASKASPEMSNYHLDAPHLYWQMPQLPAGIVQSHRRRLRRGNRQLCPVFTKEPRQASRLVPVPFGDYFDFWSEIAITALIVFTECSPLPVSFAHIKRVGRWFDSSYHTLKCWMTGEFYF